MAAKSRSKAGKKRRTTPDTARTRTRARTPQQLDRQEKAFKLSVEEGKTVRAIAAELHVNKDTVVEDIRCESLRRAEENAARREVDRARSIAFYERAAAEGLRLAEQSDGIESIGVEGGEDDPPPRLVSKQGLIRGLDSAIKARERIDKLLGLDAPIKVETDVDKLVAALLPKE
jgi:hypothetical protein